MYSIHRQGHRVLDCFTLKNDPIRSFETSATIRLHGVTFQPTWILRYTALIIRNLAWQWSVGIQETENCLPSWATISFAKTVRVLHGAWSDLTAAELRPAACYGGRTKAVDPVGSCSTSEHEYILFRIQSCLTFRPQRTDCVRKTQNRSMLSVGITKIFWICKAGSRHV